MKHPVWNRYTALALAGVMALSLLTGCQSKTQPAQTDPAPETSQSESAAPQAAEQTLTGRVTAMDGESLSLALGALTTTQKTVDPESLGGFGRGGRGGFGGPMGGRGEGSTGFAQPGGTTQDGAQGQTGFPGGQPPQTGDGQQPPAMPDGEMPQTGDGQQPPQMPDGEMPQMGDGQQPPQMPDGQQPQMGDGQMPQRPDGQGFGRMEDFDGTYTVTEFTEDGKTETVQADSSVLASLQVGDVVTLRLDAQGRATEAQVVTLGADLPDFLTLDENGNVTLNAQMGMGGFGKDGQQWPDGMGGFGGQGGMGGQGGFGGQGGQTTGTSANTLTGSETSGSFTASGTDENALLAAGVSASLGQITVEKTGDCTNTENSDFYGVNAGVLARDGASLTLDGGTVTTDAKGGNALFCYGEGTTLTARDLVIRTSQSNSGGIETAGGGTTVAENLDIETQGASAAAIRSDRGGGTVTVTGGSYVTHGTGSPAIYSTADITVSNATLNATASEALVIEGKNSITLENCDASGAMTGTYRDGAENLQGVMIYQSMSGDANVGKGSLTVTGGSLKTEAGDLFYVTNTTAEINLKGVALTLADGALLRVAGNDGSRGWGAQGANGGRVTLTAEDQALEGEIVVDEISSLRMTLSGSSAFTGTVNPEGEAGTVSLALKDNATWTLTADAYLSSFQGDAAQIQTNGHHVYVAGTLLI